MSRFWLRLPAFRTPGSASRLRRPRRTVALRVEHLEERCLLNVEFRTFDGSGNNPLFPSWGKAGVDEIRKAPVAYADGISTPARPNDPGTRVISNAANSNPPPDVNSNRFLSDYAYVWGQFVDHDLDLTTDGTGSQLSPLNIPVPTGDPQFDPSGTGTAFIPFNRSQYDPATGTSRSNPRQNPNDITAFLDGSMIYGSDATRANLLRSHDGTGHLKTSPSNMLPFNNATYFGSAAPLANANDAHTVGDDQLFVAGDVRANENIELTNIHTLFLREHNRVADLYRSQHPDWNDDQIYFMARRWVGGEIQVITYQDWLPALLGSAALPRYTGYKQFVNPGIANEFATASFRVGHSMLSGTIDRFDDNANQLPDGHGNLTLRDAFFNPTYLSTDPSNPVGDDVDAIAKGNASDSAQEIDLRVIDDVRNFLFIGGAHPFGLDLPAINMQRGRDHGLPDYNTLRAAYGLPRVTSYADITQDPDTQARLLAAYGQTDGHDNVDNIDPWLGGLAEDHVPGSSTGPLLRKVLADQFTRLRDGDRFFYLKDFQGDELTQLQHTTLAQVIKNNTQITNLQDNVFFFKTQVTAHVYFDGTPFGLPGFPITLTNDQGNELATKTTGFFGGASFDNLDGLGVGHFTANLNLLDGFIPLTPLSVDVHFTRGQTLDVVFRVLPFFFGPGGSGDAGGMHQAASLLSADAAATGTLFPQATMQTRSAAPATGTDLSGTAWLQQPARGGSVDPGAPLASGQKADAGPSGALDDQALSDHHDGEDLLANLEPR